MGSNGTRGGEVDPWLDKRRRMVERQIVDRGISDERVADAFLAVPRHAFVEEPLRKHSYDDCPLPIGEGQTISQPYIVALMTQLASPSAGSKVLEVGTGCGYQTAILSELGCRVFSIEILERLSKMAGKTLEGLGYGNITLRVGDGYSGWEAEAPFDIIIVTAAPAHIPDRLVQQLRVGGKMIIPVGETCQDLLLVTKTDKGVDIKTVTPVRFVPMTGKAQD